MLSSLLLGVSLAAPLGPVNVALIKQGLTLGFRASLPICLGAALGDLLYLLLVFFGLAPVLSEPVLQFCLLSLGSIVLVFMGFQSLIRGFNGTICLDSMRKKMAVKQGNQLIWGLYLSIMNPISIVWWLGVFGAFLSGNSSNNVTLSELYDGLWIVVGVLCFTIPLAAVLHYFRSYVTNRTMSLISALAGILLIYYGSTFAWDASKIIDKF